MTTNNQGVGTRELALMILLEIERGEKSHIVLRQVLEKYQYLSKQDRAFLTRLAEGTTERRIELDYIINQFSKVKTEKMKPVIRNILRCAVYQIKYMDQVPDSAACNEAVNLAIRKGFKNLRGFVYGVLRNIARNIDKIAYPENTEEFLSIKYSMPQWIIRMWVRDYGEEKTKYILEGFYKERATTIRINGNATTKEELFRELTGEGIQVKEHPLLASALLISGYDYLAAIPAFREGKFQVQDAASIMVAEQAGIKEGDYILDVCAAPGGKALHAAQILNGTGMVEARDLTEMKVELILENIQKLCQALPQRGGRVIVRLPLIPGCNDGAEDVASAARFVGILPNRPEMNLLPYHNLGESKYGMIGETCALSGLESRKGRDPKLLALQELCQRCAPDNRVSLGGDAIALE